MASDRRMRGITELPDGRFHVRVRRGRTVDGIWQQSEFQARLDTLAEAIRYRDQAVAASRGQAEPPELPTAAPAFHALPPITVLDASRRLCRGMVDGSVRTRDGLPYKPSVVRRYEESLRVLVLPELGTVPVATLTRGDVQRFVDQLAAERTPEHARKALLSLRVCLRTCMRYGELDQNPCSGVTCPTNGAARRQVPVLTPEQVGLLVQAGEADDKRLKRSFAAPLLALLAATGLRTGEAYALAWGPESLDLDAGLSHVTRALDREHDGDGRFQFIAPKSHAGRRVVPVPEAEVARMKRHRLATGRPEDGALVFADPDGQPLSPVPGGRAFKRCVRAAGLPPELRLHDLRHAFASHCIASGLSAFATAKLLGHSDPSLVWRRYAHPLDEEIASAGEALSAWRTARASAVAGVTLDA
jgi:integrase